MKRKKKKVVLTRYSIPVKVFKGVKQMADYISDVLKLDETNVSKEGYDFYYVSNVRAFLIKLIHNI